MVKVNPFFPALPLILLNIPDRKWITSLSCSDGISTTLRQAARYQKKKNSERSKLLSINSCPPCFRRTC